MERDPRREERLADVVRTRIRMAAASLGVSHSEIAARMSAYLRRPISRGKVSDAVAGRVEIRLVQIEAWAEALETSVPFLLGFTWDPRRPGSMGAVSDTPGRLKEPRRRLSLVTGSAG
jgi:hypothetical protein